MMRIGFSSDIHELVFGRTLVLGGVTIPFEFGEKAHSDGDVVYHALAESILGALALGDLGTHFPDNDNQYLNADSSLFVKEVAKMMKDRNFHVSNVDISIILERPKLSSFIKQMRNNISNLLEISIDRVSVKAGSNEGLGDIGQGKAVEARSIVLIEENN